MFRIERYRARTVVTSLLAGLVIAIPLCVLAVHSRRTVPEIQPVVLPVTEPETEMVTEYVRTYKPYEDLHAVYYSFIPLTRDEQSIICSLCDKYEIAYDLMLAIAGTESEYRMAAVGTAGDKGMFQINEFWSDKEPASDLPEWRTDLSDNTELALRIFTECLEYSGGDLRIALNYYNSGQPDEIEYADGTSYAGRVFDRYGWIMEQLEQ